MNLPSGLQVIYDALLFGSLTGVCLLLFGARQ